MCKDKTNYVKRADSKYLSSVLAVRLCEELKGSELEKSYRSTYYCSRVLLTSGDRVKTIFCKQRWCSVCGRIKMAMAIKGYLPELEKFNDGRFVTLTKKTVNADELPDNIKLMEKVWSDIRNSREGRRRKIKGVKKAECTVARNGKYHYHFHIIMEGKEDAEWVVQEWLKRMGSEADPKAQDIRAVDKRSYVELFKYATKLITSDLSAGNRKLLPLKKLDVIFRSLRNKRTFQPFGTIKKVEEEDVKGGDIDFSDDFQIWVWRKCDWVNEDGELFTNYKPSEELERILHGGEKELVEA